MERRTIVRGRRRLVPDGAESDEARIGRRIEPQPSGCWLYNGEAEKRGQVNLHGENVRAYRFVYETLVGPVPDGHELHHTCETVGCVNPAHLLAATHAEHMALHAR